MITGEKQVWTIGHSTYPIDVFIEMLLSFGITLLADVRRYPASRRHPQFNATELRQQLEAKGIGYIHYPQLGGRRAPRPDSVNIAWRLAAFRGYADYLETPDFKEAITSLQQEASHQPTAYMCAEAPWWRCHRALISDYLKAEGWKVMHIMKAGKADEHPYTSAAAIVDGKLDYTQNGLPFK